MKIHRFIYNNTPHNAKSIVTIGNFDGVHLGHMRLLNDLNDYANSLHIIKRILITFEPMPNEFFNNRNNELLRLSLIRDKFNIIKQSKLLDEFILITFNQEFANLSARDFIEEYLLKRFNVQAVVMGEDFRFGKNRTGNSALFSEYNIHTYISNALLIDKVRVSSSIIRHYAKMNDLINVKKYLGRNITYTAKVVHANHLGRTLNMPTINLALNHNLKIALWGIYLAYVYIEEVRYFAIASIGKNPTINTLKQQEAYKIEAHLLDVNLNLYGKIATIELLQFIRSELKFNNLDDLKQQMHQDLMRARELFDNIES